MKKQILLIAMTILTFFGFVTKSSAQDSTRNIALGFVCSPTGGLNLQKPGKGFTYGATLTVGASFNKGNSSVLTVYNINANAAQLIYYKQFTHMFGTYVVANKSVLSQGGYAGLGETVVIYKNRAFGYMELGSSWNKWSPVFYTGVILPFWLKL